MLSLANLPTRLQITFSWLNLLFSLPFPCLSFRSLGVVEYLLFLFVVMLCLRTILVAEMVNTFREVSTNAVLQVEANRMWLLPTLETSVILSSQFSPVSFKRNKEDVSKEPSLQLPDTMNLPEIFLHELFIGFHIVGRQPGFHFITVISFFFCCIFMTMITKLSLLFFIF